MGAIMLEQQVSVMLAKAGLLDPSQGIEPKVQTALQSYKRSFHRPDRIRLSP
jgi:hypothetical protein